MLTTPAMASDPYSAEAPSLRISMRSIDAVGMEFRSTDASAPVPPGTNRRPLTSTNVRAVPRPRRLTRVEPSPLLLTDVLVALPCSGSVCRKSPMEILPLAVTCSRLMSVTGAGVVKSLRRMREPVTTISSVALFLPVSATGSAAAGCVGAGGVSCCCAEACPEMDRAASAAILRIVNLDRIGSSSGLCQVLRVSTAKTARRMPRCVCCVKQRTLLSARPYALDVTDCSPRTSPRFR